jgi:hypothetical protein
VEHGEPLRGDRDRRAKVERVVVERYVDQLAALALRGEVSIAVVAQSEHPPPKPDANGLNVVISLISRSPPEHARAGSSRTSAATAAHSASARIDPMPIERRSPRALFRKLG